MHAVPLDFLPLIVHEQHCEDGIDFSGPNALPVTQLCQNTGERQKAINQNESSAAAELSF